MPNFLYKSTTYGFSKVKTVASEHLYGLKIEISFIGLTQADRIFHIVKNFRALVVVSRCFYGAD
jgi:hypothetical protein